MLLSRKMSRTGDIVADPRGRVVSYQAAWLLDKGSARAVDLREGGNRTAAWCCGDHVEGGNEIPDNCSEVGSLATQCVRRRLLETSPAVLCTVTPLILPPRKTFCNAFYFLLIPSTGKLGFLLDASPYCSTLMSELGGPILFRLQFILWCSLLCI